MNKVSSQFINLRLVIALLCPSATAYWLESIELCKVLIFKDHRQNNKRVGATFNFPVGKLGATKAAYRTGAITRIGANFSTISAAWQMVFF